MLNSNLAAQIHQVLKTNGTDPVDFNISSTDSKRSMTTVVIQYVYNAKYQLSAEIPISKTEYTSDYGTKGRDFVISCTTQPGEALDKETLIVYGVQGLLAVVGKWVELITAELRAIPLAREVERQKKSIEELTSRFDGLEDDFFSTEEAEEVGTKVDEIEKTLQETIAHSKASQKEQDQQIANLHAQMEALRKEITSLTKKGWVRKALSRIAKFGENPAVQRLALEAAEKGLERLLLPPGK